MARVKKNIAKNDAKVVKKKRINIRKCKMCSSVFKSACALTTHQQKNHFPLVLRFKCLICDRDPFTTAGALRDHHLTHGTIFQTRYLRQLLEPSINGFFDYINSALACCVFHDFSFIIVLCRS